MNAEFMFRLQSPKDSVSEGLRLWLAGASYQREPGHAGECWVRGSRIARVLSLKIEDWPTKLTVSLIDLGEDETGVMLRYAVETGLHLVGALDRRVLEAEAGLIEDYLHSGRRVELAQAVAPLRRPVIVATLVNMIVAVAVVSWVGVVGDYPRIWVAVAALLVAFLDGLVIMAFADLLVEGMKKLPSVSEGRRSGGVRTHRSELSPQRPDRGGAGRAGSWIPQADRPS